MKTFLEYSKLNVEEEVAAVNTGSAAMPPTAVFGKKRKNKILTRNYIEVLGKRRRLQK